MGNIGVKYFANPILLNENDIVIAPWNGDDCFKQTAKGLLKYDISSKKWNNKYIKYTKQCKRISYHTLSVNHTSKELLIYGVESTLFIIDLAKNNSYKQIIEMSKINNFGIDPASAIIDGAFHLIGGNNNNKHLVYDDKNKTFKTIYEFKQFKKGIYGHKIIYIQSKNLLFLMGGYDSHKRQYLDTIFVNDLNYKWEWSLLQNVKLPNTMNHFGFVITNDNEHIILFGGENDDDYLDSVYIFHIDTRKFMDNWSCFQCPTKGIYDAIITNDNMIHLFQQGSDKIDAKLYKIHANLIVDKNNVKSSNVAINDINNLVVENYFKAE